MEQTDIETTINGKKASWRSWCVEGDQKNIAAWIAANCATKEQRMATFGAEHFICSYAGFVRHVAHSLMEDTKDGAPEMGRPTTANTNWSSFRVLSWNILAHIHTHYNSAGHKGPPKSCESAEQRVARHRTIVQTITQLAPDIAMLQEVDSTFMPSDWQARNGPLPCGERLDEYTPYRSYSDRGEGTVILLRDAAFVRDRSVNASYLPAIKEHGWKTGMALHAIRCGDPTQQPIAIASVHLKSGAYEAQRALLEAAVAEMQAGCGAILGGDFNVEAGKSLGALEVSLVKQGLERVPTPEGVPTGLSGTLKWSAGHVIDHIYARWPLSAAGDVEVGPLPVLG